MLYTVVSMPLQTIKSKHLTGFYEAPILGKFVVVFIVFLRDFAVLGNHPKVFCMLGKYSSAELHFHLANFILSGFMESFLPPCYFYIFARRDIAVPDGDWLQQVYHLPG